MSDVAENIIIFCWKSQSTYQRTAFAYRGLGPIQSGRTICCGGRGTCLGHWLTVVVMCLVDWNSRLKRLLQLRFDFDSTRRSGHHDRVNEGTNSYHTTFYFGSCVKGLYQRRQSKDANRCWSVSVNVILYYRDVLYCVIIWPARCLLIGYDASRRHDKNEHVHFSS